jgi:hypothetical protein
MPIANPSPCPPNEIDVWANVLKRMMPYKHNGQDLDQWLIELVADIANIPPAETENRKTAIDRFLGAIHTLPNLHLPKKQRFSESDREAVRDRILTERVLPQVKAKIHEFYPTGKFLAPTLGKWVNEKLRLRYQCLDEYQNRHPDAFLDNDQDGANERIEWEAFAANPTLSELDQVIADEQAKSSLGPMPAPLFETMTQGIANVLGSTPTQRFITYVNTDPDGILREKSVPNFPNCTYQVLIQRLCLQNPPTTKQAIASEFGIPYQTLNAHYNRHVVPAFINQLILEQGFFDEKAYPKLKQYIEQDPKEILKNCCRANRPQVNAQFLAQRRLRFCCDTAPHSFETLVNDVAIALYCLKRDQLERFWTKTAFPLVAQVALRVLAYDLEA